MERVLWRLVVPIALLVLLTLAAVGPIRSYDFFWHLATGRWIAEHRALPLHDPFTIASDRTPWINGEWFFDLLLYAVWTLTSFAAISWARALIAGSIFTLTYVRAGCNVASLVLSVISFAAIYDRLDARPLSAAALMVAIAIALLDHGSRGASIGYVVLTVLWMNVHPSALLAPAMAAVAQLRQPRRLWLPFASGLALLVNPFLHRGILAPLELTSFAAGGSFVNAEWLPSMPRFFPLLYVTLIIAVIAFLLDGKREDIWRVILLAGFGVLAIRHIRHQPLYFAAFPLLVAPVLGRRIRSPAWLVAAVLPLVWAASRIDHHRGIDLRHLPVEAVLRLKATGLRGNIYNPDQFGGLVIWAFYPERRALTDGRNELYHAYIPEYARARTDSRAWHSLLERYRIDLAVDEYRPSIEVIDAVTRRRSQAPASVVYWPRDDWALIGFDRAAMLFARRAAFDPKIIENLEWKGDAPDR